MNLPSLSVKSSERTALTAFLGYNHNLSISEGENYEELNLTADNYPVLSVREPMGKYWCKDINAEDDDTTVDYSLYKFPSKVYSFCSSGLSEFETDTNRKINESVFLGRAITSSEIDCFSLMFQYSGGFIGSYNADNPIFVESDYEPGEKIIRMGNKFIFPRIKKYFYENKIYDIEHKNEINCSDNSITYTMCTSEGVALDYTNDVVVSATAPADTTKQWIDTSSTPHTLKKYSSSQSMWITVATTYIKISQNGVSDGFNDGDGIKISGIKESFEQLYDLLNDKVSIIQKVGKTDSFGSFSSKEIRYKSQSRVIRLDTDVSKDVADKFNKRKAADKKINIEYTPVGGTKQTINNVYVYKLYYTDEVSSTPEAHIELFSGVSTIPDNSKIDSVTDTMQNYIIVKGILDEVYTQSSGKVTFSREMPDYDVIFECNNRLWIGHKNEIFASKLGDPTNWYVYDGISSDSYALSTGTSEKFTGGFNYNGYPLFFREKEIIKIYGDYPSNYQTQNLICDGVKDGCGDSIVNLSGYLYYYSPSGVTVYSGSYPTNINSPFGNELFTNVMSAALKNVLYYVVKDSSGKQYLFSYDTQKGIWHKLSALEDTKQIYSTAEEIYFVAKDGNTYNGYKLISDEEPNSTTLSDVAKAKFINEKVSWKAESGQLDGSMVDRKYVQKLLIKYSLKHNSKMRIYISYDNGDYELVFNAPQTDLNSYPMNLKLRRCDHYRLLFEGEGPCDIYSITKTIIQGSDRR